MVTTDGIPRTRWEENLTNWRNGWAINLPQLYVLPQRAKLIHEQFVKMLGEGTRNFLLVRGENGAGKTAYVQFIQELAIREGYVIAPIRLEPKQIQQYGPLSYFNKTVLENARLPDGSVLMYKIDNDGNFRQQVNGIVKNRHADLVFWNTPLTYALLYATDVSDDTKRGLARSWLRGEAKYVSELKELQIYDRAMKSILNVPTDKVLYFLRDLAMFLGYRGLFVVVDEIERVGLELTRAKAIETLSIARDIIDPISNPNVLPAQRGVMNGLFIIFAISTFFLGYSGIIEAEGIDFRAQADKYGKPKATIGEIPRLDTMLKHNASSVVTDFSDRSDLQTIAQKVILCYSKATGKEIHIEPVELANQANDRVEGGRLIARMNIQEMIHILDERSQSPTVISHSKILV